MLVPNQKIKQKWNGSNIKWYKEKGYVFTKRHDEFEVDAEDLTLGNKSKVEVECDICKKIYLKEYYRHIEAKNNGGDYCNKCKGIKIANTTINKDLDTKWQRIENVSKQMGYKLISTKEDYVGTSNKIKYECKKHGVKESIIVNFLNLHGCIDCAYEKRANRTKNSIEKVVNIVESVNNNKLLNPHEYINAHTRNLIIKCGCCEDGEFTTSFINYKKGQNRCIRCSRSMSKNEKRIEDFLKSLNIEYKYEKTFPDCRDEKVLPFDFYLTQYNLCIEFDGEQHFNDHMYSTFSTLPYVNLEYVQKHDKIKTEYCKNKNINLLRISYLEENNIEKIITNELKRIEKLGIRYSLIS